jgi:hypothetical protein
VILRWNGQQKSKNKNSNQRNGQEAIFSPPARFP